MEIHNESDGAVSVARGRDTGPQPYMNPYLAGIGLGVTLLAAFVFVGRGLGASGAFNSVIAWAVGVWRPSTRSQRVHRRVSR